MIHLRDVTYFYPRATVPALAGLSLDVPAGQFCAVIGANGAGKSTLCYTDVYKRQVIWLNGLAKTRPTCPAMAASDAAGTSTPATSTWPVSLPR